MSHNNECPSILIVDDMTTNRKLLQHVLTVPHYNNVEAASGEEALQILDSGKHIDLVLLDVMMPGIDGFTTCKRIRDNPEHSLLPVIILTTLGAPTDIVRGLDVGATEFVSKPFNALELRARVNAAVAHKRLTDRLDDTESVLFSLARMVEARDKNTGDHCDRLSYMAVVFGDVLGLDYDQKEALRRGGILHDIGKLGIPDKILLKKGKLDSHEWEVMKQHTTIGAALCGPLRTMRRTVDIVQNHHERWDGSGYPAGLKGEEIPLLARIFQILDIYDALSTERPYKEAFPAEKVINIMKEETEKGFWDPGLMKTFLGILENEPERLVRPKDSQRDRSADILEKIEESGVLDWYR